MQRTIRRAEASLTILTQDTINDTLSNLVASTHSSTSQSALGAAIESGTGVDTCLIPTSPLDFDALDDSTTTQSFSLGHRAISTSNASLVMVIAPSQHLAQSLCPHRDHAREEGQEGSTQGLFICISPRGPAVPHNRHPPEGPRPEPLCDNIHLEFINILALYHPQFKIRLLSPTTLSINNVVYSRQLAEPKLIGLAQADLAANALTTPAYAPYINDQHVDVFLIILPAFSPYPTGDPLHLLANDVLTHIKTSIAEAYGNNIISQVIQPRIPPAPFMPELPPDDIPNEPQVPYDPTEPVHEEPFNPDQGEHDNEPESPSKTPAASMKLLNNDDTSTSNDDSNDKDLFASEVSEEASPTLCHQTTDADDVSPTNDQVITEGITVEAIRSYQIVLWLVIALVATSVAGFAATMNMHIIPDAALQGGAATYWTTKRN